MLTGIVVEEHLLIQDQRVTLLFTGVVIEIHQVITNRVQLIKITLEPGIFHLLVIKSLVVAIVDQIIIPGRQTEPVILDHQLQTGQAAIGQVHQTDQAQGVVLIAVLVVAPVDLILHLVEVVHLPDHLEARAEVAVVAQEKETR